MNSRWRQWFRYAWPGFAGLAMTLAIWFAVPVPYIVYEPGPAANTKPMVVAKPVDGGQADAAEAAGGAEGGERQEGAFLLTTVRWTYANVFKYVWAQFDDNAELWEKELITRGDSRDEYVQRQQLQMRTSHGDAMEAAYRELGIDYAWRSEHIVVFSVVDGLSADGVLLPGDRLLSIDGVPLAKDEDVRSAMEGKRVGDIVRIAYRRGDEGSEERTAELKLLPLPDTDPPRPGMGVSYGTLVTIESEDPAYRVDIRAGSIGGPSAGLMFALEIADRFTEKDLTGGHLIAGTGEISPDGTVGTIGGVAHKVVGAHRRGADIFFVPPGNADAARKKAASIGTSMVIVEVATLREALDYLTTLPPSTQRTGER